MHTANSTSSTGWAYRTYSCASSSQLIGERMNTRMNDNRYSASGSTQNSGMAEMSVDM